MNYYYIIKKAFSNIKPKTDDKTFVKQVIEKAKQQKS